MTTKTRSYVWTLFEAEGEDWNPNILSKKCPIELEKIVCEWVICQLERSPTTNKLHLQGAVYYKNAVTFSRLKKDFGDTVHIEIMRGKHSDSKKYCSKPESQVAGPWELGECPVQGKRMDWTNVKDQVLKKVPKSTILMECPHLAPCVRGIDALIDAAKGEPPLFRTVETWYIYGPTGTGKTHRAMTKYPDAFRISGAFAAGKSFDTYNGEETLILDEWSPAEWPLTLMNNVLDKWRYQLQCRFFNKYAYWTRVIICSNWQLPLCYNLDINKPTFDRRITHYHELLSQQDPDFFDPINPVIYRAPSSDLSDDGSISQPLLNLSLSRGDTEPLPSTPPAGGLDNPNCDLYTGAVIVPNNPRPLKRTPRQLKRDHPYNQRGMPSFLTKNDVDSTI